MHRMAPLDIDYFIRFTLLHNALEDDSTIREIHFLSLFKPVEFSVPSDKGNIPLFHLKAFETLSSWFLPLINLILARRNFES